jgi:hypothetical protein
MRSSLLLRVLAVLVVFVTLMQGQALAQTLYSPDYSISEAQFGSGSLVEGCSSEYCAQSSAGDLAVGQSSGTAYGANNGFNTTDVPTLEVITEMNNQDLGVLDTGQTATTTALVKVRTYLCNGFTMQITGNTPHMGTRHLIPLLGATASEPGTEQFGVNLVANSSPSIGADPVTMPDNHVDTSLIKDGYNTPNEFKYLSGDTVAESNVASGETHFTISMMINISDLTPGGYYSSNFSAVVTPAF